MSRRSFASPVPMAPRRPKYSASRSASRKGAKDAKKYASFGDETITHSLLEIQSMVQIGQHLVNQWALNELAPLIGANQKIRSQIQLDELRLSELVANPGNSGRERKAKLSRIEELRNQIAASIGQEKFNTEQFEILLSKADEARKSWISNYEALASIYIRALNKKLRGSVKAVAAKVPPFTSVPLVELQEYSRNGLK